MFVRDRMTVNPVTIAENAPISEAGELMRKNKIARLPVVKDGKLIGIITEADLLKLSPSAATTLSVWELNYVLSKIKVSEGMTKNPITISPDATLEEAAMIMREKNVGALPVVEEGRLIGIITESNIFDAFIDLMGLKLTGTRLTINLEDRIGAIADLTETIKQQGINIISMALFHYPDNQEGKLVLRLGSDRSEGLLKELQNRGFKVEHVVNW
ncbi:MAG: CBS domain-containing protein [Firmicutes bacterium]|nr:CBS domain-containing protein [Bacillota bacterium]